MNGLYSCRCRPGVARPAGRGSRGAITKEVLRVANQPGSLTFTLLQNKAFGGVAVLTRLLPHTCEGALPADGL